MAVRMGMFVGMNHVVRMEMCVGVRSVFKGAVDAPDAVGESKKDQCFCGEISSESFKGFEFSQR